MNPSQQPQPAPPGSDPASTPLAENEPTRNQNRLKEDPPGKESPPPPLTREQQPGDYIRTKEPPEK